MAAPTPPMHVSVPGLEAALLANGSGPSGRRESRIRNSSPLRRADDGSYYPASRSRESSNVDGQISMCRDRSNSGETDGTDAGSSMEDALEGAAVSAPRSGQLSPINTHLHPSLRRPSNTGSLSASSSNTSSSLLSHQQHLQSESSTPTTPSAYARSTHPSSQQSSPAADIAHHSVGSPALMSRNAALLSTSPSKGSTSQAAPLQRVGSPSHSIQSGGSSDHSHPQERSESSAGDSLAKARSPSKPSSSGLTSERLKNGNGSGSGSRSRSNTGDKPSAQVCAKCDLPMTGQFVRALGAVFHLDCFRCQVSRITDYDRIRS